MGATYMNLNRLTSSLTATLMISAATLSCKSANPNVDQDPSELESVSKAKVVYTCIGRASRSDCSPNKEPLVEEFRLKLYSEAGSDEVSKALLYFTDSNADNTYSKVVEEFTRTGSVFTGVFSTKGKDPSTVHIKFDNEKAALVKGTRHESYNGKRGFKGTVSFDYSRKGTGTCQLVAKTASNHDPVICVPE